jgi:hypothetical protein
LIAPQLFESKSCASAGILPPIQTERTQVRIEDKTRPKKPTPRDWAIFRYGLISEATRPLATEIVAFPKNSVLKILRRELLDQEMAQRAGAET